MANEIYYILNGKTPVAEPDMWKWGQWMETTGNRVVRKDEDETGVKVSTVFLGIDHSFGSGGPPLLFETMVFGGPLDQEQDRCSTWEEAELMHESMCGRVKQRDYHR